MEFKDRLNKALEMADMTPAELSRKTGIAEGTISCYRSGLYEPKQKRLKIIADALNVSVAYLLIGAEAGNKQTDELQAVYFNIAKQMQEENMDPDDIQKALLIAKTFNIEKKE